jgi:hypothetical protein
MHTAQRFRLLALSRSWSYDYWADIHHELPSRSIPDHGPTSFMEHMITVFDAAPTEAVVQALLKKHDAELALYDGHVERVAFTIVDEKSWKAIKTADPWRRCNNDDVCVYHQIAAFDALKARYPNITIQAISKPATHTMSAQNVMTLSGHL